MPLAAHRRTNSERRNEENAARNAHADGRDMPGKAPGNEREKAMSTLRWVMLAIPVGLMAVIVGGMLVFGIANMRDARMPFPPGEPAEVRISGGQFTVTVQDGEDGAFQVSTSFVPAGGGLNLALIEPRVTMTTADRPLGQVSVALSRRADGTWSGTGRFPRPGRWLFRVSLDNNIVELEHIAP